MTVKQFKLTNDEEIICEVIQWDDPDNAAMVVRGAMRIVLIEDFKRGVRFYAFRPWMGFTDDPSVLQSLNAAHIIGEVTPSADIIKHYDGTIKKIKKEIHKRDMPLDEIQDRASDMSESEFEAFLSEYLKENDLDIFDPDLDGFDSDAASNVIKFKPKGTMH